MANKEVVVNKCYDCGGSMEGRRENYRYSECGLDSVTLVDVLVFHCKCGAITPEIPSVEALHENIAIHLLRKNGLLAGDEIKFLRKMAGYKGTKLASIMGIGNEIVSRWETGKKKIGKESDRLVRFACLDGILRLKAPQFAKASERMLEHAKMVASFRLPDFLAQIDEECSGPKNIRINPEILAQFGDGALSTNLSTSSEPAIN